MYDMSSAWCMNDKLGQPVYDGHTGVDGEQRPCIEVKSLETASGRKVYSTIYPAALSCPINHINLLQYLLLYLKLDQNKDISYSILSARASHTAVHPNLAIMWWHRDIPNPVCLNIISHSSFVRLLLPRILNSERHNSEFINYECQPSSPLHAQCLPPPPSPLYNSDHPVYCHKLVPDSACHSEWASQ